MKKEINKAVLAAKKAKIPVKVDEIFLFREMAKALNSTISKCTYVDEVHGKKGFVTYNSKIKGGDKTVEIGDLLLVTFDKATNETRISILQAKFRKRKYRKFLTFTGDIYQRELLHSKPDLKPGKFPVHILNFRNDYKSITAYTIFYIENNEIDLLYTLPHFLKPSITATCKSRSFRFDGEFIRKVILKWNTLCIGIDEVLCNCSLDDFEKQVLRCRVGAPINDDDIMTFIKDILKDAKNRTTDHSTIDEILANIDLDAKSDTIANLNLSHLKYRPAMLIVSTNSRRAYNLEQ